MFPGTHNECQVFTQKLLKNTLKEGHEQLFQEPYEHRSKYIIILPNNEITVIRLYSCSGLKTSIKTEIQGVPGLRLDVLKTSLISDDFYYQLF